MNSPNPVPRTRGARRPILATVAAVLAGALMSATVPGEAAVRELATDRPDVTESPYSVPKGWVQLEMDALIWSRHEPDLFEVRTLGIAASNLKLGLTERADVQVVFEPWVRTRLEPNEAASDSLSAEDSGPGELAVRLKWNLLGNDGGRVALGLLPWVAWDTGERGTGAVDAAGLAVPLSIDLAERFGFGAMAEASTAEDEWALLGTATLAMDVAGSLGMFGEIAAERAYPDAGSAEWRSTLNVGATLGLGPDLQLDSGARFGLTDTVEDVTVFLGFAVRRPWR